MAKRRRVQISGSGLLAKRLVSSGSYGPPLDYTGTGGTVLGPGPVPTFKPGSGGGPTKPPPGTYDPALEAQRRAGQRGLAQLLEDIGTANTRDSEDFAGAMAEMAKRKGRADEDFGVSLQNLQRRYATQGWNQGQSATVAGVAEGGTLAASAARRAENQGMDEQPIRRAHDRFGEDYQSSIDKANRDHARALADRELKRQRGVYEEGQHEYDITQSELYQSKQNAPSTLAAYGQSSQKKRRRRR